MLSITIIIIAIISIFIVRYSIQKIGISKFRRLAEALADQVYLAQKEFYDLYVPTHLIEDKDIEKFHNKHQSLMKAIETLEKHKYYNEEIYERYGICKLQPTNYYKNCQVKFTNIADFCKLHLTNRLMRVINSFQTLLTVDLIMAIYEPMACEENRHQ